MLRFCANLSMLFTEVDFLDRFAAAAEAGFTGVEYLFPYDYPAEELKARLDANGLTQVLFNLPAGDWAGGERGIACRGSPAFRCGPSRSIGRSSGRRSTCNRSSRITWPTRPRSMRSFPSGLTWGRSCPSRPRR